MAAGVALNTLFVAAEAVAGVSAGSLALLADAGHNAGDVLGLLLGLHQDLARLHLLGAGLAGIFLVILGQHRGIAGAIVGVVAAVGAGAGLVDDADIRHRHAKRRRHALLHEM